MTVVLVAPDSIADDSDVQQRAQQWVDDLEERGHDVYLVAQSLTGIRAGHHVVTRGGTADTVRAVADAMEGVQPPVLLLAADALGSVVTVEEVGAATGTAVLVDPVVADPALVDPVLADPVPADTDPVTVGARSSNTDAPLRVVAGVVVGAGSDVHVVSEPTHYGSSLLCVDAADADSVAGAVRVMADVAGEQQWTGPVWPLTVVAAVRAGVIVHGVDVPGLPWGSASPSLTVEQEARLRIRAAAGAPQGFVDRIGGRRAAEVVSFWAWRAGVGAHAVTVVSVAAALMAGLLISTGTRSGAATAAFFLLASVFLDRVDGILARARRTVTSFGAWLDVTTDRIREAALVIGLGLGAAQSGSPRWGLASAVLALLTAAHLAAAASRTARGWGGSPVPIRLPLDRLDEPVLPAMPPPDGRPIPGWLPFSISRGDGAILAVVALILLPLSALLALLAALAGLSAVVCLVLVGAPRPLPAAQRLLFELADPGPLARLVSEQDPHLSVLRRVLTSRAAAWVPALTWVVESAVVLVAAAMVEPAALPITIAWIAVLAFHRLDIATRQRVLGSSPPTWLAVIGLGALGRVVLVVLLAAVGELAWGLAIGAVVLGVVYATESSGRFAER